MLGFDQPRGTAHTPYSNKAGSYNRTVVLEGPILVCERRDDHSASKMHELLSPAGFCIGVSGISHRPHEI